MAGGAGKLYNLAMAKISVSIIGHNEAHNLPRCLGSLKWADEVVYVDCASADGSAELAGLSGARVFRRPNDANLNVNKQYGIDQCAGDWVLYLDPDEVVGPELAGEIKAAAGLNTHAAYLLPRRNHYFGRWLRRGGKYPDRQLRLFRRGKASFPCVDVHERLSVAGSIGRLGEALDHYPYNNSAELLRKLEFYAAAKARRAADGRRPVSLRRAARRFASGYLLGGGFLDGPQGFVSAAADLFSECLAWLKAGEIKK